MINFGCSNGAWVAEDKSKGHHPARLQRGGENTTVYSIVEASAAHPDPAGD